MAEKVGFYRDGWALHSPTEVSKEVLETAITELQEELKKRETVTVTFTISWVNARLLRTLLGYDVSIPKAVAFADASMGCDVPPGVAAAVAAWGKNAQMFYPVTQAIYEVTK